MTTKETLPETLMPQSRQECHGHHERCPLCAQDNACRVAKGHLYKGPCWCHQILVPQHLLRRLAENFVDPACLCRPCLENLARLSREGNDTETILEEVQAAIKTNRVVAPAEPDYYLDEFGNTVFTAAYHLKRGNCCGNQCRHCPY
jgi:hypothetical protein